jgi:hypothetical protein
VRAPLRPALLLAGLAPGLAACAMDEPWTFGVTRAVYEDACWEEADFDFAGGSEGAAVFVLAVLAFPVAVDLVLLPIALPHDLLVVD